MASTFITDQQLKRRLGGVPFTDDDTIVVAEVVDAVNAFIARVRPDLATADAVPGDVAFAAAQLALRWYDKRGANLAASFSELGYIPGSVDKDVEMALQIGRYQPPVAL